jgi:hypothetical protein
MGIARQDLRLTGRVPCAGVAGIVNARDTHGREIFV